LPGFDRRDFIRRLGASIVAAIAVGALKADARISTSSKEPRGRIAVDQMSHATFAPCINQSFELRLGHESIRVNLIDARLLAGQTGRPTVLSRREPFSLIFRAPRETNLPQQIFEVIHEELGS